MKQDEKKIENLIDQLMANDSLEQPSIDFTKIVMSKVEAVSNSTATVYKPLISKSVWFIILGSYVALVAYIYLKEPITNNGWFKRFEWSGVTPNLNFSSAVIYAFVLLAMMVGVQVPLLKHYFNKRMAF
tara:strand:- start:164 stop:550 length:387 start_codon:yes stop_codon:yes gene_type:complete